MYAFRKDQYSILTCEAVTDVVDVLNCYSVMPLVQLRTYLLTSARLAMTSALFVVMFSYATGGGFLYNLLLYDSKKLNEKTAFCS